MSPLVLARPGRRGDPNPSRGHLGNFEAVQVIGISRHVPSFYLDRWSLGRHQPPLSPPMLCEQRRVICGTLGRGFVVINELMAPNRETIGDPWGDADDWVQRQLRA